MEQKPQPCYYEKYVQITKLESRNKHSRNLDLHIQGFDIAMHILLLFREYGSALFWLRRAVL